MTHGSFGLLVAELVVTACVGYYFGWVAAVLAFALLVVLNHTMKRCR